MNGPLIRIVLSIIFAAALLIYLFHGAANSMQPQNTVHSTLTPAKP
jgi:hypothetical protein